MKNKDLLIEENTATHKSKLRRLKPLIFISCVVFFLVLVSLHLLGGWEITRSDITHYDGDLNSSNTKILSVETKFRFDNDCLLFRQSHNSVETFEGNIKDRDVSPLYWQFINSLKFAFTEHVILMLSFFSIAIFTYYLIKVNAEKKGN